MKQISYNIIQRRLSTILPCKMCGKETYVDSFFYGIDCGCHDKFYLEHNNKISQDIKIKLYKLNNFKEKFYQKIENLSINFNNNKVFDKNINIKDIISSKFDKISGVWSL